MMIEVSACRVKASAQTTLDLLFQYDVGVLRVKRTHRQTDRREDTFQFILSDVFLRPVNVSNKDTIRGNV